MLSTVAVLGTGGAIASTVPEGGATPSLSHTELVQSVPALKE